MKKKIQILLIHGGMTFRSRKDYIDYLKTREVSIEKKVKWSEDYLDKRLGKDFEIIRLKMPLQHNAKYEEWKIHFERFFPFLNNDIILIGQSLGGIFLAKYLSENRFPKKILSIFLIGPPYDDSLPGEDLKGGFSLKKDLSMLDNISKNLRLLFSEDDNVVPLSHAEKFRKRLKKAEFIIYKSKNGHFKIPVFPEMIRMIKKDAGIYRRKDSLRSYPLLFSLLFLLSFRVLGHLRNP